VAVAPRDGGGVVAKGVALAGHGAALEQHLHDLEVALLRRGEQARVAVAVERVDVGARVEERAGDRRRVGEGRRVQRRLAAEAAEGEDGGRLVRRALELDAEQPPRLLLLVLAARHPEEVADLLRREDLPLAEAAEARREGRERR